MSGCGGGGGDAAVPAQGPAPPAPAPAPPRRYTDVTTASGIAYEAGYLSYLPSGLSPLMVSHFATSGVAAGDFDRDGDIDLFITRGDIGPNLLYRNDGNGVFVDIAAAAGLAYTATSSGNYRHSGPAFADMDGDRDLDLFIGGLFGDPSLIFLNNGNGTFTDVTAGSGIDAMTADYTISAAFGDYDLDGDLDMFLAHWGTDRDPDNPGDTEHLWRNDSSGGTIVFTSVSVSAGISPTIVNLPDVLAVKWGRNDWTFTPTFARIDDDLYPDILIVADYNNTQYFRNNGDGTFTNATDTDVLTDVNGMGSAVADFDNDGDLDWFVTAIRPENDTTDIGNRYYENRDGEFVDMTAYYRVRDGGWGWGACAFDFENDGDLDIYHTNGWELEGEYLFDTSRAFTGSGGGPFAETSRSLGLNDTEQGRGVVCADFDNDGDIDIFQQHTDDPVAATMWRNESTNNNFLKIELSGLALNTEAAGARIYVTANSTTQMREITIGSNFISQNPAIQTFGLGTSTLADAVRVEWPDGLETSIAAVTAGQTLSIAHPGL